MAKRVAILFTFIFLTALFAMPALAQFGAIEGDVKAADGKPLVGAQIVIDRLDMKGNYKVKTDKKQVQARQQAAQAGIALPPSGGQPGQAAPKLSKEEMAKIQEENNKREQ